METWIEAKKTTELLEKALAECKRRGMACVAAEANYYTKKAEAMFRMKENGYPVTFIEGAIKGVQEVCEAMTAYHAAEVEYKNAAEAVNVYKKKLGVLQDELRREWSAEGDY